MLTVPRPRPPYLHRQRARNGETIWYVRMNRGPRVRIRGEYGSPEFAAAYRAAVSPEGPAAAAPKPGTPASGSLAWLIARYRDSSAWTALSRATRRQRENIFRRLTAEKGGGPFLEIGRVDIVKTRDRHRETPFAARNFLQAMRGLFRWALDAGFVTSDPTSDVRSPRPPTEGFPAWTEEEIARFEKYWPIGTKQRLALAVLLYTGLRRGDASRLGRQHVRDGVITLRPEKGGPRGPQVVIPILPALADVIARTSTGDLAFIATLAGAPMTKESFGNWFHDACRAAGVRGSAHGLRKAGATRAANNGATVAELEAIYGWSGGGMASLYTRNADRVRLARGAIEKLNAPESGTPIPSHKNPIPSQSKLDSKNNRLKP